MSYQTTIQALEITSGVASLATVIGAIVASGVAPEILPVVAVGAGIAAVAKFRASQIKHRLAGDASGPQTVVTEPAVEV